VSTNGNARLTQREMTALRAEIAELRAATAALDAAVEPPVAEPA
jgi:hypothetical protein